MTAIRRAFDKSLQDAMPEMRADAKRMQESPRILTSLGVNQMAYVGQDPSTVEIDGVRFLHVGDGKYQVVADTEYIETLERAVLKSWMRFAADPFAVRLCLQCGTETPHRRKSAHAPDCIVPALLAKYEESS